ncbi:hypothetical protein NPIL_616671 [Nephila pilipes]|uniref:Uncharacterized protein n=1 Tax=Nephila pilipes TaxID=299642 RepID=A0A8X6P5P1_NEPPI|nr:hypothetical protein NPIL_616671 [Nephila pilipes]
MKIFLLKLKIICLLTTAASSLILPKKQGCPEPVDTRPCTCYNSPRTVLECQNVDDSEILRNVFRNSSRHDFKEVMSSPWGSAERAYCTGEFIMSKNNAAINAPKE